MSLSVISDIYIYMYMNALHTALHRWFHPGCFELCCIAHLHTGCLTILYLKLWNKEKIWGVDRSPCRCYVTQAESISDNRGCKEVRDVSLISALLLRERQSDGQPQKSVVWYAWSQQWLFEHRNTGLANTKHLQQHLLDSSLTDVRLLCRTCLQVKAWLDN